MKKCGLYIQESNALAKINEYCKGNKVLIVMGSFQLDYFKEKLTKSLLIEYEVIVHEEECTEKIIQSYAKKMKAEHFDAIIGFGGGKILDVVKAIAYYYPCFLMVIPSSASMDGACSALSVLYHEDHSFDRFLYLDKNPDVVLVDSSVIANAPLRLLCAGMMDALSSYYDVMYIKDKITLENEVLACAQECYKVLAMYPQVKADMERKELTSTLEDVIHINIYESAVAFENAGCEYSHILANATTHTEGSKGMHGERVGVGILFMLLLEGQHEEYKKVQQMLIDLTMPSTLHELMVLEIEPLVPWIQKELQDYQITYSDATILNVLEKIK